jgi:Ser/Thr protein kinase RdoA (MazF antagonist)
MHFVSRRCKYKARVRCPRRIFNIGRAPDRRRRASLVAATKLRAVAERKFSIFNDTLLALLEAVPELRVHPRSSCLDL